MRIDTLPTGEMFIDIESLSNDKSWSLSFTSSISALPVEPAGMRSLRLLRWVRSLRVSYTAR